MHTIEESIKRPHFSEKPGVHSRTHKCVLDKNVRINVLTLPEKVSEEINPGQMNAAYAASMTVPHLRVTLRSEKLRSSV